MTDPRDYRRTDIDPVDPGTGASNALWGWVAAALFVAAVLLFVFASGSGDQSASNGINLPPTASAPKLPPSTTGAGTTTLRGRRRPLRQRRRQRTDSRSCNPL